MIPLLSFSPIIVVNSPKLSSVPGNTFEKRSASYFLHTGEHLIKYFVFVW